MNEGKQSCWKRQADFAWWWWEGKERERREGEGKKVKVEWYKQWVSHTFLMAKYWPNLQQWMSKNRLTISIFPFAIAKEIMTKNIEMKMFNDWFQVKCANKYSSSFCFRVNYTWEANEQNILSICIIHKKVMRIFKTSNCFS